eukprot:CAMPEP_0205808674 /NCGR_PEP_ID=MMETSP0205-20121125/12677_1 /ASSEMBLY_ACC=CAM_ASM_000278 /TAXON_ID=36767 /ORGANISM="Euplotes focardii, Strain TN1" /LENGTH=123 /DNA_ID=CAMNT_0053084687 /DNA_START=321 /DNA_END=689 /DNA_ORIENTATION=+
MTGEIDHFKIVGKIEKAYEKKIAKAIKKGEKYENDPINFRPKKQTIDLKRMLDRKLEKLNKKTENALIKLMKQNIMDKREKQKADFSYQEGQKEEIAGDGEKIMKAAQIQERADAAEEYVDSS